MTIGLLVPNMGKPDLIIDALFGTGLNGTLKGDMLNLINWINQKKTKIISVDIPSGLNSNSGTLNPISIMADDTITFGSPKLGMYFRNGPEFCGNIILEDNPVTFKKGDWFMTGSIIQPMKINKGDKIKVNFNTLGKINLDFI